MDSMDVNKGIAAVLVAGIAFFLTGLLGDNLIFDTPPSKPALDIKVAPAPGAGTEKGPAGPAPIAPLLASANVQKGDQFVHQVCAACHSFNEGGKPIVGPNLYGIVGAPHDHEAGFSYSAALEKLKGQPWTYEALNKWLDDPQTYAPGTRMTYTGIKNNQTRGDVIAYLHTLSHNPVPFPKVTPEEKTAAANAGGAKPAGKQGPPEIDKLLASANVDKGKEFAGQVCAVCHTFDKGGHPIVGPNLYGVVGGPHDHEKGFDYSAALQKYKGQPWTYEALNKWLTDPQTYAPGTRMTFAGIKNPQTRADVIDWLHTLSDHPEPLPSAKPEEKAAAGKSTEKTAAASGSGAQPGAQAPAPGTAAPAGNHSATATASAPNSAPASSPNTIGPPNKAYNPAQQAPNAGSSAGGTGTSNAAPSTSSGNGNK
jgi:cytochrome c